MQDEVKNTSFVSDNPIEVVKEEKFTITSLRPYAYSIFNLSRHTFEAVVFENNLDDDSLVTKDQFRKMYDKYSKRPITN